MDIETAISKVKTLGDAAINWRDIIKEYREGASMPEPATADDTPGDEGNHGFMMV